MTAPFARHGLDVAQTILTRWLPCDLADDLIFMLEDYFEKRRLAGRRDWFPCLQVAYASFKAVALYKKAHVLDRLSGLGEAFWNTKTITSFSRKLLYATPAVLTPLFIWILCALNPLKDQSLRLCVDLIANWMIPVFAYLIYDSDYMFYKKMLYFEGIDIKSPEVILRCLSKYDDPEYISSMKTEHLVIARDELGKFSTNTSM